MSRPRLEHVPITVRQLISEYSVGNIVIPEFQREYVWRKNKAPKLLDSLYHGFPISSLLLWRTDDDGVRARSKSSRRALGTHINWLIDGQQRTITLAKCLSGEDGIRVLFNP